MMKSKFIITLLTVGILASCVRDLEISEPEYSDVGWLTSDFRNTTFTVGINDFMTFTDLSVNAVEHKWTISEGSFFLKGPITRNDSILDSFIIPNAGLVSEDKTINVLFTEGGLKTVNFHNTFKDSVSFRTLNGDIPSVREGNLYVMDTTFIVDVYDTIVPIIDIRRTDGSSVPFLSETDVIEIEAGDFLEFVDLSIKDRITTRTWRVEENGFVNDSIGSFQFKKLGEFKAVADFTREGENIPFDFERFEIPATFKVIPSSQPFVVSGDIVELEDETIQVPFNGEFAPFGSQEEFFTVMLLNDTGDTAVRELEIESIKRNSADATLLEITLTEPIYRPDMITVSYDGNGTLQSTDTRDPVAFSDLPVVMHNVNLWDDTQYGMEEGPGGVWTSLLDGTVEYSTEQAFSGNYSLKITSNGPFARASGEGGAVMLEPGVTYDFTWKVWIDPSTDANSYGPWLYMGPDVSGPNQQFWQDLRPGANKPRSEWITETRGGGHTIPGDAGLAYLTFRINGNSIIYIDDVKVVKREVRP